MITPCGRRTFLSTLPTLAGVAAAVDAAATPAPARTGLPIGQAELGVRITGMETTVVRATRRTAWIFVRLSTNDGMTGLGEASMGGRTEMPELAQFFDMVRHRSPFEIERYRQNGRATAADGGRVVATAFSAIEQAQWDLVGKALGAPVYDLTGGAVRHDLPVYANINRATSNRTPEGFAANARQAAADGFRAIKAAPFDGFPPLDGPAADVEAASELGIASIEAMREAIGPDVDLKIDVHSFFDVPLAIEVARRLEPQQLSWYEEPVPPTDLASTKDDQGGDPPERWRAASSSSASKDSSRCAARARSTSSCRMSSTAADSPRWRTSPTVAELHERAGLAAQPERTGQH